MKRACFYKNTNEHEPSLRARRSQNIIMRAPSGRFKSNYCRIKNRYTLIYLICLVLFSCSQDIDTPAALKNFSRITSSEEVVKFSKRVAKNYDFINSQIIGKSSDGKDIIAVRATAVDEENKLKVMIFAQQHGNEQSGKEALLLLLRDMHQYISWLEKIDLWIVPQVNPDGGDLNERRNAIGLDLNRDHVVVNAPETQAVRMLFNHVMPHVTIDIHEYNPFRESWAEFGGYKTFDMQIGVPTNLNVSEKIRNIALDEALPEIEKHLNSKGYSFHNYLVGPVPTEGRTRHSTVDINDGRQSFAILNTLSFIYEGINGRDGFLENLERRTYGQYETLIAHIGWLYDNAERIADIVESERKSLITAKKGEEVVIRMDHFSDGKPLVLPLLSSKTEMDTVVEVENFHSIVKPLLKVKRPEGYLIPADDSLLVDIIQKHNIFYFENFDDNSLTVFEYFISEISEERIENFDNKFPIVEKRERNLLDTDYIYVPVAQLNSNFLVLLFEPQSMLGLPQIEGFEHLMFEGEAFPILRVE